MFRIFAMIAILTASAAQAFAGPAHAHADGIAISNESLIERFELAVEDCRGDEPGEAMMLACTDRDAYLRLLDRRMLCENDNHEWFTCKIRRKLEPSMDFSGDSDLVHIANDSLAKRWRLADVACKSSFRAAISTYVACADRELYRQLLEGRQVCLADERIWAPCRRK